MTKVKRRKVLLFTGFHPSVAKNYAVFASTVWEVLKKPLLN